MKLWLKREIEKQKLGMHSQAKTLAVEMHCHMWDLLWWK